VATQAPLEVVHTLEETDELAIHIELVVEEHEAAHVVVLHQMAQLLKDVLGRAQTYAAQHRRVATGAEVAAEGAAELGD